MKIMDVIDMMRGETKIEMEIGAETKTDTENESEIETDSQNTVITSDQKTIKT